MLAVALLSAKEVEEEGIAMLGESDRSFVEKGSPLEGSAVQALALRAVTVLGVYRVAVVFKLD